jgi:hypothetical protein
VLYELKKLNPRIVDRAIALIRDGSQHYTCNALRKASKAIHKKGGGPGQQYVALHRQVHSTALTNYEMGMPSWWNSARPCKASRIKALEKLKAHIIKENTK